jgi:methionyl-tRNA synthetase
MSADIAVPHRVYAHGFITVEGQKLSKTLGNVIDPNALVDQYGADAVRFYLFAQTPFDQDGDFSKQVFLQTVNSQLANNLGNLLNRIMTLIDKNCASKVPDSEFEHMLREECNTVHIRIEEFMEQYEFAKAINAAFALVDLANKYVNDEKPWALFKEGKTAAGEKVLYSCLEVLRRTAMYLYPFTPKLSADIWHQLGFSGDIIEYQKGSESHGFLDAISAGQAVRNAGPIFRRIEETVEVTGAPAR